MPFRPFRVQETLPSSRNDSVFNNYNSVVLFMSCTVAAQIFCFKNQVKSARHFLIHAKSLTIILWYTDFCQTVNFQRISYKQPWRHCLKKSKWCSTKNRFVFFL